MPQPPVLRPWQRGALVLSPLLVLVAFAAVLLGSMLERRASTDHVQATYRRLTLLHELRARIVDAETGQRGYIITGDSAYLGPYVRAEADVRDLLQQLDAEQVASAALRAQLDGQVGARFGIIAAAMAARAGGFEAAREQVVRGQGFAAMTALRATLRELETIEQARLESELAAQRTAGVNTLLALGLGFLVTLLAAGYTNRFLVRHGRAHERLNAELNAANASLQEQALELEVQAEELQLQSTQLEENAEELQLINRELEQRTHDAEVANEAKTTFLRAMSHELRTPLNAIEGYTDLLELEVQGRLNEEQRGSVQRIKYNSRHLLMLINDILSFAKLEAGRVELHPEPMPAADLFRDMYAQLRPLLDRDDLAFRIAPFDPGLTLHADPDRARQILLNLVTNAVKHGGAGCSIEIGATGVNDHVDIWVRDTGPGIPRELQHIIFEPFVQAPPARNGVSSGVGLGLAISRALARSMGGDITLESAPGAGSCFRLVLPRSVAISA